MNIIWLHVLLISIITFYSSCGNTKKSESKTNKISKEYLNSYVASGDTMSVKALLDSGISINTSSNMGNMPIHACMVSSKDDTLMLKLLLRNGADVNAKGLNGSTPLKFAIVNHNINCIKILLRNGAKTKIKDDHGYTIYDILDKRIDPDAYSLILKHDSIKTLY